MVMSRFQERQENVEFFQSLESRRMYVYPLLHHAARGVRDRILKSKLWRTDEGLAKRSPLFLVKEVRAREDLGSFLRLFFSFLLLLPPLSQEGRPSETDFHSVHSSSSPGESLAGLLAAVNLPHVRFVLRLLLQLPPPLLLLLLLLGERLLEEVVSSTASPAAPASSGMAKNASAQALRRPKSPDQQLRLLQGSRARP